MTKAKYKNYYIGVVIALLIIFAVLYYFMVYETSKQSKYKESYLVSSGTINLSINKLNEIEQVFSEVPDKYFVFISYTQDESEYKLEKKLQPIIEDYSLKDSFYLINITKQKDDDDFYDKINETFNLKKDKINSIPIIVYFENKEDDIEYHIIDPNKLESFLIKNEFEKVSQ